MNIKKHIPNLFTLGNLFCGTLATMYAFFNQFEMTAIFVVSGIFLDFLDGFIARILKVQGELGKQLDSLADMVTSGVVPGIVMFTMIRTIVMINTDESDITITFGRVGFDTGFLPYLGLILTLAACYRLAKFNIDTRQSESFIGLPTPAMSLFVVSLPLIYVYTEIEIVKELVYNKYFLIGVTLVLSYLMNANIHLFSLKFKSLGFKENVYKYLLLVTSGVLLFTIHYLAIPIIILVYILLSVIKNVTAKSN